MKLFGLILGFDLLPILIALTYRDVEDCGSYENSTIRNRFGLFVGFGSAIDAEKDKCSMQISNPWSNDMQNGFGVFLPRSIDCSLNITIQCLPGSALVRQAESSTVEYTCRTSPDKVELSCSRIELIFTRNRTSESVKKFMGVQIVALAKAPCRDDEILFQCPDDYLNSCLDRKLRCNGRSECPSQADEMNCQDKTPTGGFSTFWIILGVLCLLSILCLTSTVLICFCCRATCQTLIHRFQAKTKHKTIEKGDIIVVSGEDAGLIRGLTIPQQHIEPTTLIIDSTKPVYPRV